jgi:hypothetical protein
MYLGHTIEIHEESPVHSNKSEWLETLLEPAQISANEMARIPNVKSNVVAFGFNPVDFFRLHQSQTIPILHNNPVSHRINRNGHARLLYCFDAAICKMDG